MNNCNSLSALTRNTCIQGCSLDLECGVFQNSPYYKALGVILGVYVMVLSAKSLRLTYQNINQHFRTKSSKSFSPYSTTSSIPKKLNPKQEVSIFQVHFQAQVMTFQLFSIFKCQSTSICLGKMQVLSLQPFGSKYLICKKTGIPQ